MADPTVLLRTSTRAGTHVGDQVVRDHELDRGRRLLDTRLGTWPGEDSEATLITRAHWGVGAVDELRRARTSFIAFRDGVPQHAAHIQSHTGKPGSVVLTHDQLVTASRLGARWRLYLVFACSTQHPRLLVLRHPASLEWTPSTAPAGTSPFAAPAVWRIDAHELVRQLDRTTAPVPLQPALAGVLEHLP